MLGLPKIKSYINLPDRCWVYVGWCNKVARPCNTAPCLATSSVTMGPVLTKYSAA